MPQPALARTVSPAPGISPALTAIFAVACGALVGNLYYAQPLIGLIAPQIGLSASMAGFIVTLTQLGYGAGLILVVSLADLLENRRLILLTLAGTVLGLVGVALSQSAWTFLVASFVVGFCSVGAQILVPFAAHLAPEGQRGRVIGNVMGGLLAGIMLARPLASILAAHFGWRAIFWLSAASMLALMGLLVRALPHRQPLGGMRYGAILLSAWHLLVTEPVLQRRSAYQALLFAGFNLFWTAAPLMLSGTFGFTQRGIALFALAGAGGALAAPVAGRLADRGFTRPATGLAMAAVAGAFLAAGWAEAAGAVLVLVVCALVIDGAVQTNQILSQRAIYALPAEARGRLNAVYMTTIFCSGAAASALGAITYAAGGWRLTSLTGAAFGVAALAIFATERRGRATSG